MLKRIILTIGCIFGLLPICSAQTTTLRNLVEEDNYGEELTIQAQLSKIDDYSELVLIVEDHDYVIPIRLLKRDLGAEKRLRTMNLRKGDTLVIAGRVNDVTVQNNDAPYKGLDNAEILIHLPKQGYDENDWGDYEPPVEVAIPFRLVETKPSFRGGDANQFSKWVNERLLYPEIAKKNRIHGRVMLQFTIEADGSVTNVRVLSGVDPSIDKEAVRVDASSPKWSPGKQGDRAVRVTYTFPIIFDLSGNLNEVEAHLFGRGVSGNLIAPRYQVQKNETVVVFIWVDVDGNVKKALPGAPGTTINDAKLFDEAKKAAMETHFSKIQNKTAETQELQYGTITYIFKSL